MSDDDEWWDVLDANGVPTGGLFRRGDPGWPLGSFRIVVGVCVLRSDGSVLLTQRAAEKEEFPFAWEFPGGSALAGESSREAAGRELLEETGLNVAPAALHLIARFAETSAFVDFYVARVSRESEVTVQKSEVLAAEWVTPDEVERRLDAGVMAAPWVERLDVLWPLARRALRRAQSGPP